VGGTSRISREAYVRFCERLGVKFPGPTRQSKWRTHEDESTEAGRRDGAARSSYEVRDKRMERRGCIIQFWSRVNRVNGRSP
jgi:hypothetical protein